MSKNRYIKAATAIGQTFGRLTVLGIEYRKGRPFAICRCECGNECVSLVSKVRYGYTRSCGCLHDEITGNRNRTHGLAKTPTHRIWLAMKHRCHNPRASDYRYYGGRGITVCDQWRHSFSTFLADMGERPAGGEIDRIDNDRGYEPGNCRWADRQTQTRNSRQAIHVTHNGKTQCVTAWAEELGFPFRRLLELIKQGKSIEEIVNKARRPGRPEPGRAAAGNARQRTMMRPGRRV